MVSWVFWSSSSTRRHPFHCWSALIPAEADSNTSLIALLLDKVVIPAILGDSVRFRRRRRFLTFLAIPSRTRLNPACNPAVIHRASMLFTDPKVEFRQESSGMPSKRLVNLCFQWLSQKVTIPSKSDRITILDDSGRFWLIPFLFTLRICASGGFIPGFLKTRGWNS